MIELTGWATAWIALAVAVIALGCACYWAVQLTRVERERDDLLDLIDDYLDGRHGQ